MENIQKDHKLLFDIYDVNRLNSISYQNFLKILKTLGLSEEFSLLNIEESNLNNQLSFEDFQAVMGNIVRNVEHEQKKFLFDQYSNAEGLISKTKLRELLNNHLDNMCEEDVDNLIEDFMLGEESISYDRFRTINIF